MKKLTLTTALALTMLTQLQASSFDYNATKDKVAMQYSKATKAYTCWKNDGYYPKYTTIAGVTIKTYSKCKEK